MSYLNDTNGALRIPAQDLQGADLVKHIQNRMTQRDVKTPGFNKYAQDVLDTKGFPTQSFQHYQNQFNVQQPTQLGARIPEQGPLGPGLVGGTTPQTGINLPGNLGTPMGGNFTLTGISSGLRRNDGSIVEGTTGNLPTTVNNQSMGGNLGTPMGTVNNNIMGGGDFTLTGMTQQPMQQPMQQPIQNPLGGGLSSLNQQPFGGGLGSMNQQPQQMNGGLKGLLDSYIGNYIKNYFMNALK